MKLTDLFFVSTCALCNCRIESGSFCENCALELAKVQSLGKRVITDGTNCINGFYLFEYDKSIVKHFIYALKRKGNRELFSCAGKLLSVLVDNKADVESVVTFVPRRKVNVRTYGYDHANKIARFTAKYCVGNVSFERLLKRRGFSTDQKMLDSTRRKANVKNKFRAIKKDIPKNILLVDDVVTTGSSVMSCVAELKKVYGSDIRVTGIFLASSVFNFPGSREPENQLKQKLEAVRP